MLDMKGLEKAGGVPVEIVADYVDLSESYPMNFQMAGMPVFGNVGVTHWMNF